MRHINLKDNKLIVTFRYDPEVVGAIRNITGRKYEPKRQHWEIPVQNVLEALDALIPHGFTPTLDVKRAAEAQRWEIGVAEEIKALPAEYDGLLPLFPFQKTGAKFLKSLPGVLLADVPGLGKTIQTIAALEEDLGEYLILCPASLKYSWAEEIKKWKEGDVVQVVDGNKTVRQEQWKRSTRWKIANYELLLHDWDITPKQWDAIVCDEATRVSNPSAKTTKLLKLLSAKKRIALTGTPVSNSPEDIYSIIDWISPRYLGSYYQFLKKYCVREERYNRIIGYQNLKDLSEKVSRFMLRRTKEEVFTEFPPKIIENIIFELSEKERKLYEDVRLRIAEEVKKLDIDHTTLALIPVKMLRLKQVADHSSLISKEVETSSKLDALKEILKPVIASGDKAIVFTQFAEMAKILYSELNTYKPRLIHGEISAENRQKAVEEFINDEECGVIVMTEAGAYGLNLQAASYVVHYDLPWSVSKLMQREDRAHRIGQTKPVTVYNLIAKNTIDEYVAKVLHKKQKISVSILGDEERLEDIGMSPEDVKTILRI